MRRLSDKQGRLVWLAGLTISMLVLAACGDSAQSGDDRSRETVDVSDERRGHRGPCSIFSSGS